MALNTFSTKAKGNGCLMVMLTFGDMYARSSYRCITAFVIWKVRLDIESVNDKKNALRLKRVIFYLKMKIAF